MQQQQRKDDAQPSTSAAAGSVDHEQPKIWQSRDDVQRIIRGKIESEYDSLRGCPGFCHDPLTWEQAKALVQEGTDVSLGKMGRTPANVAVYWDYRSEVLNEYRSMDDFAKIRMLGHESVAGPDGKLTAGQLGVRAISADEPHIVWRLNDFPYNVEEGIEHHNLWSTKPLSPERLRQEIAKHRKGWEWCHWVNPASLASIPSTWHAHILSRRQRDVAATS